MTELSQINSMQATKSYSDKPIVRQVRNLIYVDACYEDMLASLLSYTHIYHEYKTGKRHQEKRKLFYIDENRLYTFSGFADRILSALKNYGYDPEFVTDVQLSLPFTDSLPVTITTRQFHILSSIATHTNGIYDAPTGYGKTFMTRCICGMYPNARILISTKRKIAVKASLDELKNGFDKQLCDSLHGEIDTPEKRITLITSWSIPKLTQSYDILLYDEVHTSAEPKNFQILSELPIPRRYGFSATPVERSDNAGLMVEALFGPIREKISFSQAVADGRIVPLDVTIFPITAAPLLQTVNEPSTYLKNKLGIWHNPIRNKMIAEITNKMIFEGKKVLILIDKVEHGKAIKKFIPTIKLVHSKSGDLEQTLNDFIDNKLRAVMATSVFLTAINVQDLDVIIRADGVSSFISIVQGDGRAARKTDNKQIGHIIDFYDMFDYGLKKRSENRISVYKEKGWTVNFCGYQL